MQITFSCISISLHYDTPLDLSNSLNKMNLKTYLRNEIDIVSLRLHPSMDTKATDDEARNGLLISFSIHKWEYTKKQNPLCCHYDYHYHQHLLPPYDDKKGTIWQLGEYQAQLPLHHYPVAITLLPHIDPCNATKRGTTIPTI